MVMDALELYHKQSTFLHAGFKGTVTTNSFCIIKVIDKNKFCKISILVSLHLLLDSNV